MEEFRKRILRPLSFPLIAIVFVGVLVISLSRVLLAVPTVGSTLVALLISVEILGVAFVLSSTSRVKPAQRALMVVLGLALLGGGAASADIGVRHEELVAGVPVAIAAKSINFDTKELHFPADTKVSLHFTNDDVSVQHNVAIFTDESQSTVLFRGATITGPASIPYAVPPLKPGHYYFHCDVHPQQMKGAVDVGTAPGTPPGGTPIPTSPPVATTSVPPPPAGGTPVTSLNVVAKNISFDLNQIILKANSTITLTLDNQDPGIPHNLAILTSETGTKIFGQAPFSGPAKETWTFTSPAPGQYFFHCEVHPTMKGTVIVR
jgi:plastocyanin